MLKVFRVISIIEGLSYLLILSVTLGLLSRDFVSVLGMTHGALFTLYMVFSLIVSGQQKWSVIKWLAIFVASLIPLAFIPLEMYLKKVNGTIQND